MLKNLGQFERAIDICFFIIIFDKITAEREKRRKDSHHKKERKAKKTKSIRITKIDREHFACILRITSNEHRKR